MTLAEVLVLVAIVGVVVMIVLTALPRQRELARNVACQKNLSQIGRAIVLTDESAGRLPGVPPLGAEPAGPGPLATMLDALGQEDFSALSPERKAPGRLANPTKAPRRIPGFLCPSDPNALSNLFHAPVSYRATTGSQPDGRDGAFAPGRRLSLAQVEAGDGQSFTAAFSERLVGDGRDEEATTNYAVVPGGLPAEGVRVVPGASWKGDAGSSWLEATWRSTLYNHAIRPQAAPSFLASDGRAARMGASSGHDGHVYLLMFDGAVRPVARGIDPAVWKALANTDDGASRSKPK
ncbi:MAG TPA: DUF1559 domain-containing protein [Isosphaeraceae bacterium]|nr:DUF1559 domain-containing protein [Isosphaeraceae bacterium]